MRMNDMVIIDAIVFERVGGGGFKPAPPPPPDRIGLKVNQCRFPDKNSQSTGIRLQWFVPYLG